METALKQLTEMSNRYGANVDYVIAGGGNDSQIRAASEFASHLGLAFQIRDDMLDVIGTQEDLGKAVGVDSTKNTFVQLYGVEKCGTLVAEHTQKAITALNILGDSDYLKWLAKSLTNRNK